MIASRTTSFNQIGFVKGQKIQDCIVVASKCVNMLSKCGYGGKMALKLDVCKAFDTLS